jgi:hypothetical protein
VAGVLDDERVVVRVSTMRTIKQVDERLAELRAQHPALYVLVTPGYVDRLHEHFDDLVGQREAVAGTQALLDLFDRRSSCTTAASSCGSTSRHRASASGTPAGCCRPQWVRARRMRRVP